MEIHTLYACGAMFRRRMPRAALRELWTRGYQVAFYYFPLD